MLTFSGSPYSVVHVKKVKSMTIRKMKMANFLDNLLFGFKCLDSKNVVIKKSASSVKKIFRNNNNNK